jgi:predicted esterase
VPEDPNSAYNIACGHAKMGNADQAFEWLGKAADWGFGNSDSQNVPNVDFARQDPDLESLRADPRFEEVVGRMAAMRKALADYVATPEIYVPAALANAESMPLLVLLHGAGKTKQSVLTEQWKSIADELGTAIVAPSGKIPAGVKPEDGMVWIDNGRAYEQSYWTYEKPVDEAVKKFRAQHTIDPARLFLAGEEQGGFVAFNIAIAAPGLYKGVVVVDSPFNATLARPKAANAAKMGFKARFVITDAFATGELTRPAYEVLQSTKLEVPVWIETLPADAPDGLLREVLISNLRALAEPAAPVAPAAPEGQGG